MFSTCVKLSRPHLIYWCVVLLCFFKNGDKLKILWVFPSSPPCGIQGQKEGKQEENKNRDVSGVHKIQKNILLQSQKAAFSILCGCRPCSTVLMFLWNLIAMQHIQHTLCYLMMNELNLSLSASQLKYVASPLRQATPRRHTSTVPTYWLTGTSLLLQM